MNDRTVKIKKFIAGMDSLEEVAVEMKNRGKLHQILAGQSQVAS